MTTTPDAPGVPSRRGLDGTGPAGSADRAALAPDGDHADPLRGGRSTGGGACEVDPVDRVACEVYGKARVAGDSGAGSTRADRGERGSVQRDVGRRSLPAGRRSPADRSCSPGRVTAVVHRAGLSTGPAVRCSGRSCGGQPGRHEPPSDRSSDPPAAPVLVPVADPVPEIAADGEAAGAGSAAGARPAAAVPGGDRGAASGVAAEAASGVAPGHARWAVARADAGRHRHLDASAAPVRGRRPSGRAVGCGRIDRSGPTGGRARTGRCAGLTGRPGTDRRSRLPPRPRCRSGLAGGRARCAAPPVRAAGCPLGGRAPGRRRGGACRRAGPGRRSRRRLLRRIGGRTTGGDGHPPRFRESPVEDDLPAGRGLGRRGHCRRGG